MDRVKGSYINRGVHIFKFKVRVSIGFWGESYG